MSDLFKGFEQLLELVKTLEEKSENGEIKTNVQFNSRPLSSIPRTGNIPRSSNMGGNTGNDVGTSRMNTQSPPASGADPSDPVVPPDPTSGIALKDIGGLSEILKELKELVAIPLKRPDLLAKLGLEPT
ncbi:MAG: AAA family ATPase, partial [Cuspidothrix sp.]